MKYIISGTNRPGSRTLEVSRLVQKLYADLGEPVEIIDLTQVGLEQLMGHEYGEVLPDALQSAVDKVTAADGLIVVCPEYNGSMPGALKYFIDHWKYPETYEFRPICLIGLGGRFGGLRPVEHLQGIFGYRNAYIFPLRVFLSDIWKALKDGQFSETRLLDLLKAQAAGFQKFCAALRAARLDANTFKL